MSDDLTTVYMCGIHDMKKSVAGQLAAALGETEPVPQLDELLEKVAAQRKELERHREYDRQKTVDWIRYCELIERECAK